jgi:glyoxylase-like metal-dependent hydrolase (beta-lactamase superfamily II)
MASADGPEPFELFALRYARHQGRTAADNFIGGDSHDSSALDYYVWVARRSDRLFVIDTGFGEEAAGRRQRELLIRPASALAVLGIDAAKVEDVVLTHLHFDHAGTIDDFPRARLHLQDSEAAFATGRCMCHEFLRRPFDVEDVVSFVRRLYAGHVCFHDGVSHLADGLSLHRIGGHSTGLQAVRVWTRRGWVVLASDAAHLYANFRERRPFPVVVDAAAMLEGYRILHELASSPDHIIPGHDPLVMALYPAVAPELEGRVVRLDVDPRQP